ncbi:uncharacterized protein NECHADRAFT_83146 [Fusarium vanettenii 77-13-4]|uniref:Uncharacterized protein n=1 Tax=Fusarium vanettenii (strain ATCC MYA-4622 / CBS 123669 / FGSC 9596 / NRRL 45880 / 77-13-4) TaxID=660122 RepID=C7ZB31_FUSV7|nr:uncharacterized protein NECHADRAFT_83146 [Fusarium vanettenii 77-13-4]EEU38722.1 predicted protein [Fusarium vanettenii 77-13-4]
MHCRVLVSLAFALGAVASPCVPPNSVTTETSTSLETSETSTLSTTSSVPTTSSTSSDSTASSTTFDSATESTTTLATSTIISITSSATSDVTTSSTIAPTSTSSPVLETFNAIGQGGGTTGTPARLPPPQYGSITLGGYNPSNVPAGIFSIEAVTGALIVDGSKICGFYSGSQSASLYVCNATPRTNEAPVTCNQGQMDGGVLKCSAPAMACIEDFDDENDPVCYPTGGVWTQFAGFQFLGNYFFLSLASETTASTGGNIPIDLLIQAV